MSSLSSSPAECTRGQRWLVLSADGMRNVSSKAPLKSMIRGGGRDSVDADERVTDERGVGDVERGRVVDDDDEW